MGDTAASLNTHGGGVILPNLKLKVLSPDQLCISGEGGILHNSTQSCPTQKLKVLSPDQIFISGGGAGGSLV